MSFELRIESLELRIEGKKKRRNKEMKITLDTSEKVKIDSSPDKSEMTNQSDFRLTTHTSFKLSASFNLSEFVISQVAERHGYKNQPNEKQIENLRLLCVNVLQPLRDLVNSPIIINSGFRSFDVNVAVGGRSNSQHLEGKAADLIVPSMGLVDVFNLIHVQFPFDQLIFEFGKWIHVSYNSELNRKDLMISKMVYGKTVYEKVVGDQLPVISEERRM